MGLGGRMFAALWASRPGLEAPAPSPTNGRRPRPRFSRAAALIFVGRDRFDGLPWQRIPVTLGDRSPQMGAAETVDSGHDHLGVLDPLWWTPDSGRGPEEGVPGWDVRRGIRMSSGMTRCRWLWRVRTRVRRWPAGWV